MVTLMKNVLLLGVFLVVLSACEQPVRDLVPPIIQAARAQPVAVDNMVSTIPTAIYNNTRFEERREAMLQSANVFHGENEAGIDFGSYFRSDAPLSEKHAAARALLQQYAGPEWYFLQQMVAGPMLALTLEHRATMLDRQALATYARTLIANENPGADLLAPALTLLQDDWSDEEIAAAAQKTHAAAAKWLKETCAACTLEGADRVRKDDPENTPANPRYAAIQGALPILASLSHE